MLGSQLVELFGKDKEVWPCCVGGVSLRVDFDVTIAYTILN